MNKESVRRKIVEKDKNMAQESSYLWKEISIHNYDFDRKEMELNILEEIKIENFQELFDKIFFSSYSKRLDLELTSVKHKYNQAEYLAENQLDEYFFKHMKRKVFPGNITDFKKQALFMDDNIKLQYMWKRGIYSANRPVLGYWNIRGLAANIRYQLHYCGVEFDQQIYTSPDDWFKRDK